VLQSDDDSKKDVVKCDRKDDSSHAPEMTFEHFLGELSPPESIATQTKNDGNQYMGIFHIACYCLVSSSLKAEAIL